MKQHALSVVGLIYVLLLVPCFLLDTSESKVVAAPTNVNRILSPDGTQVAFGQILVGQRGNATTRIIVCDVDGTSRSAIPADLQNDSEVLWMGNDTLIYSRRDEREYRMINLQGENRGKFSLPDCCDVLYKTLSPNGRCIAFSGGVTENDDVKTEKKHGVFVYDRLEGTLDQLWAEAIKTAPAWSPDSLILAIGNAGGYIKDYPLSIATIDKSLNEKQKINGVGVSWSPRNDAMAFTTNVVNGGSWNRGIPMDGQLGVWDLNQQKLVLVSQEGVNSVGESNLRETSGCFAPVWSKDGELIAYQRYRRYGDEVKEDVWVVRRDGTGRQKILNHAADVTFAQDNMTVVWVQYGRVGNVRLDEKRPDLGETPARSKHQFSVFGSVLDKDGRPIVGARIRVATGICTFRTWEPVSTNERGEYRIFFSPGIQFQDDPVQLQMVNVTVEKDGYSEISHGTKGKLAMAYQRPQDDNQKWYQDIVFALHPHQLDFVLERD